MLDKLEAIGRTAGHAATLIFDRTAAVDPWLLGLGVALYLAAQTVRPRGWHTILRAAFPQATDLRPRDVIRAYLAGAGINAIVPARGGDVVKLALVRRRIEGARFPTLAATFIPETLFETAFGTALVAWGLAMGFIPVPTTSGELPALDVSLVLGHPILSAVVVVALVLVGRRAVRALRGALRQGMAILSSPRRFVFGVASWQALARLIRLGAMAAFMAAFGLPVTAATVVLVMAAQGGGRILPLAPASAGLRLAMLSYGFVEVTGRPVDIAAITAFTFGVGAVTAVSGLAVAAVILAQEFGTLSPRRAIAAARAKPPEPSAPVAVSLDAMREIAPGLFDWTAFNEEIGQDVHSHYARDPGVLIDPMPADARLPGEPRLVVLTNRHHLRHAAEYGWPIRCHEAGLHEFEGGGVDVGGFAFGEELAPGVRALEVGVLCPEETALHVAIGDGFLALADAIIRDEEGRLAFVPDFLLGDDPAAVRAGLVKAFERLLEEEDFDGLLLAHGDPTPRGARAELEAFLDATG